MAINAGTAFVQIKGDFGPLRAGLRRAESNYSRQVEGMGRRLSNTLKTAAKVGGVALAAGAAVGAKKAFDEFEQAEKVTRQTEAALKSTGGAANVSAKQIENLAAAISRKSAVDDEAIQSAENLLLTFTSVRNEAGKGNDIFNQATSIIADMSAALGQDFKSSTIQIGKALQDPIKGLTALRRVGVNFNEQQSEQVKRMVESGHQLEAQKFILRELNTEFAGSAKAQATSSQRIRVAFDNLFESIGRGFAPAIEKALDGLSRFADRVSAILDRDDLTGEQKFDRIAGMIVDAFEEGFRKALEVAARFAPRIAAALVKGFIQAPALVQLVAGAWVFAKGRKLLAAFGLLGRQAGTAFSAGAATTAPAGLAAGAGAGALVGGALGGAAAGAGGAAAARHTKGLQQIFGPEARSGMPVSQLGPAAGAAAMSPFIQGMKGAAKTGGGIVGGLLALSIAEKTAKDLGEGGEHSLGETLGKIAKGVGDIALPFQPRMARPDVDVGGGGFLPTVESLGKLNLSGLEKSLASVRRQFAEGRINAEQLRGAVKRINNEMAQRGKFRGLDADPFKDISKQLESAKRITPKLTTDIIAGLDDLPIKARRKAAQMVLDTAAELKRQGKIKGSLRDMKQAIEGELTGVGRLSLRGPTRLRQRMASGFEAMVGAVADPTSRMADIVRTYLEAFGAAGIGKISGAIAKDKAVRAKGHRGGLAQGGFLSGSGRRDTIPIMAAPGEAVLNRHQQRPVETALRTTYGFGLDDLFRKERRPHFMAEGGFVKGYQKGGIVPIPGQPGESIHQSILRDVLALIKRYKLRVTDGFAPSGHAAGGEHPKGLAIDVVPGAGGSWDLIDRLASWAEPTQGAPRSPFRWVGYTGDAGHGRGNHLHLSWGGGGDVGIDVPQLGKTKITGRSSVVKNLAQAAVDKTRRAAQAFLDRQAVAPVGTSSDPGDLGGTLSKPQLKRLWSSAGGAPELSNIMAAIALAESSGKPSAHGPPDGRGLWQIEWPIWGKTLGRLGNPYDPQANARMAREVLKRQGLGAWVVYNTGAYSKFLAEGGFVDANAGLAPRVSASKKKDTKPKGLKKPPGGPSPGKDWKWSEKQHKWVKKGKRPALPGLGRLKFLLLDPLQAALDNTIPTIGEQITALSDSFGETPEFYPDERVVPRLQREGHNIQKIGDQFIDWSAVEERKSEIGQLLGQSYRLIGTPFGAPRGWMEYAAGVFPKAMDAVNDLVAKLKADIAKLKQKVKDNVQRIKVLDRSIKKEREKKKGRDRHKIERWDKERRELRDENERLTGVRDPEGSLDSISEGRLGRQITRRNDATQALEDLTGDRQSFMGISGLGGDFATTKSDIKRLTDELGTLTTERIKEQITPSSEAPEPNQDIRNFLQAMTSLFKDFGPNFRPLPFQRGGIIPGIGDGDKVHVLAEPGEAFINKRAVQMLGGPKAVEKINRIFPRFDSPKAKTIGYQTGGVVTEKRIASTESKVINVTNNFKTTPEDPHSWSRQLEFELRTAI